MLAGDRHRLAERSAKQIQLCPAEALASGSSFADRAVMLDEQATVAIGIVDDFGHVAFLAADGGEGVDPVVGCNIGQPIVVAGELLSGSFGHHCVEAVVADSRPDRFDERHGEIGVPVGEQLDRHVGQRPLDRWPPGPVGRAWCRPDQAVVGQVGEMLPDRFRAHLEPLREFGAGEGTALQNIDDPSFRRGEAVCVGHGSPPYCPPAMFAK